MVGSLFDLLSNVPEDRDGFDWKEAMRRLVAPVARTEPWRTRPWRFFDEMHHHTTSSNPHPYYYQGNTPPSLSDLTDWLWTPETAAAFSILLLALTVVACCWFSHKVGEWMCTAGAGFLATILMVAVFLVFISQWL